MRWFLLSLALMACTQKRLNRLSPAEFDHFYALRVFMDEDARRDYLRLQTEEERNAYLQEAELWDNFYQYEPHIRDLIVAGDVQIGWSKEMLVMSWGRPYDVNRQAGRDAVRSELLVYRFEQHDDGNGRYDLAWEPNSKTEYRAIGFFRKEVIIDDDIVAEIRERDGW